MYTHMQRISSICELDISCPSQPASYRCRLRINKWKTQLKEIFFLIKLLFPREMRLLIILLIFFFLDSETITNPVPQYVYANLPCNAAAFQCSNQRAIKAFSRGKDVSRVLAKWRLAYTYFNLRLSLTVRVKKCYRQFTVLKLAKRKNVRWSNNLERYLFIIFNAWMIYQMNIDNRTYNHILSVRYLDTNSKYCVIGRLLNMLINN
jgi:hypothetical protein